VIAGTSAVIESMTIVSSPPRVSIVTAGVAAPVTTIVAGVKPPTIADSTWMPPPAGCVTRTASAVSGKVSATFSMPVKLFVFSVPAVAAVSVQAAPAAGASSVSMPAPPSIVPVTLPPATTNLSVAVPPVTFWISVNVIGGNPVPMMVPAFAPVSVQTLSTFAPTSVFVWLPPVIVTVETVAASWVATATVSTLIVSVPAVRSSVTEWSAPFASVCAIAVWNVTGIVAVAGVS